jgi:hypothetical protein
LCGDAAFFRKVSGALKLTGTSVIALFSPLPLAPHQTSDRLSRTLLGKKPELWLCSAAVDVIRVTNPKVESVGPDRQTTTQLLVAHSEVISNFTAFKCCDQRIGNAPPSYNLPIRKLTDFETQIIRLSHAVRPPVKANA